MDRLNDAALNRSFLKALEILHRLLETDPERIAAMSTEEVEEGLRMMDMVPRRTLPENLRSLVYGDHVSAAANASVGDVRADDACREGTCEQEEQTHPERVGGKAMLSVFGMFLLVSLIRILRSKSGRLWCLLVLLLAGIALYFAIPVGLDGRVATQQGPFNLSIAAVRADNGSSPGMSEADGHYKEKLNARILASCFASRDLPERLGSGKGKRTRDRLADSHRFFEMLSLVEKSVTAVAGAKNAPPFGLPIQRDSLCAIRTQLKQRTALELTVRKGIPVIATADGVVVANTSEKQGKRVELYHGNGFSTVYERLSGSQVVQGETVRRGQTIGYTLGPSNVNAVNLVYRVYRCDKPQNTLAYAKASQASGHP